MRRIKALVLTIISVLVLAVPVFAVASPDVTLNTTSNGVLTGYSNMLHIDSSSGYAVYNATTTGTTAATKVVVSVVVQRKVNGVWENVPYTYATASTSAVNIITAEGSRFVEQGYFYRVQSVHTAYAGSTVYTEVKDGVMQWY